MGKGLTNIRKFGLNLAEEKTKIISFSRFGKHKNGRFDTVSMAMLIGIFLNLGICIAIA